MRNSRKLQYLAIIVFCFVLTGLKANSTYSVRFKAAEIYTKTGMENRAIKIYEKMLQKSSLERKNPLTDMLECQLSSERIREFYQKVAKYYFDAGDKKKARKYFELLKEQNPRDFKYQPHLYILNQQHKKLVNLITNPKNENRETKLPSGYENTPLWRFYYGIALIKEGKYAGAKKEFSKLTRQYPYLATFHYYLAYVMKKMSFSDAAKKEYEIAYNLDPEGNFANETSNGFISEPLFDFIGIWDFKKDSGNIANDSSGNYNNGTLKNVKQIKTPSGYVAQFFKKKSFIVIPDAEKFRLDGKNSTVVFKFRPVFNNNRACFLYTKGRNEMCLNKKKERWLLRFNDPKRKRLVFKKKIEPKWYITVQRIIQGKEQKIMLFDRKGLVEEVSRKIGSTTGTDGENFLVGQRTSMLKKDIYFRGEIGKIMIFNRALSNKEIECLHRTGWET